MEREGANKTPTISFSLVASTNVEISPPKFLTFSINALAKLVSNVKAIPSASSKLLNLNAEYPSRILLFSAPILIKLKL